MRNPSASTKRRRFVLGALGTLTGSALPFARSNANEAYPSRSITFICPWPPGGASDITMRNLVALVSREFDQEIVVENRAGGSAMVGTRAIVNAKPDGYTIGLIPLSVTRFAQLGDLAFNPLEDITYLCRTTGQSFGIVVHAETRFKTLHDLIAYTRVHPGELTYSHAGLGTAPHVGMELFLAAAGLDMKDVPQKGSVQAIAALQNGKVDVAIGSTTWSTQVSMGRMRMLATLNEQRLPHYPDVPTLTEVGYKIVMNAPNGVGAPKGLTAAIELRLREAFKRAVLSDEYRKCCEELDVMVMYQDADEYRRYIAQNYAQDAKLIERLHLKKTLSVAGKST